MIRILTAIVFLPILFATIWHPNPLFFAGLATVAILLGMNEFCTLASRNIISSGTRFLAIVVSAGICVAAYFDNPVFLGGMILFLIVGDHILKLTREPDLPKMLLSSAAPVFGVVYVALLGGFIISLRVIVSPIPDLASKLLTLFFIVVFAGDTLAYYTGRTLGRHKLAPRISPGKTIEGAIGGLAGNVAAGFIAHYTFFPELPLLHVVPLGIVMGVLGILGDLYESMLKRGAEVKDAGKLVPGHGGLLDRLDSMVFNAPLLYYYSHYFLRQP